MKSYYIRFLIGLVALSGGGMVAAENEVEKEDVKALTLHTSELQISSHSLEEDEIDKFGEKILSGGLDKGEIDKFEPNQLQELIGWIQENMYRGVAGLYSNNQFIKIAKGLELEGAVELERATAILGEKKENVEYISKITILDKEKTKNYLQSINDRIATHNKKYPYRD